MAELWEQDWNRLPFNVAVNVREMGGYPTKDGGRTNYHRFLRANILTYSTPEEVEFLYKYGVRCTIDLRGLQEAEAEPEPFIAPDVETHHVPLYEVNVGNLQEVDLNEVYGGDPSLTDVYHQILELNRESVGRVFKIFASAPEGCILFNCTIGKDRTGIIAFLLLMLAGCDKYDCIANYIPSATHLMRWDGIRQMMADPTYTENRRSHVFSVPENGEFLYKTIEEEFGGIRNYLLGAGVTAEELEAVRMRLVG